MTGPIEKPTGPAGYDSVDDALRAFVRMLARQVACQQFAEAREEGGSEAR